MLGRKTTKILADVYCTLFGPSQEQDGGALRKQDLYDFLYERDWQPWFLEAIGALHSTGDLRAFIMKLHTGESLASFPDRLPPEQWPEIGGRILKQLAENALAWADDPDSRPDELQANAISRLLRLLGLDGYEWKNGRLYGWDTEAPYTEDAGIFQELMGELGLPKPEIIERSLQRSEEYCLAGKWRESIAHSRKLLEVVLGEVAARHHSLTQGRPLDASIGSRPPRVRDYLREQGLLDPVESQALAGVYELLGHRGDIPYLDGGERAMLARHLALLFSRLALLKLRGALAPTGVEANAP